MEDRIEGGQASGGDDEHHRPKACPPAKATPLLLVPALQHCLPHTAGHGEVRAEGLRGCEVPLKAESGLA